MKVSFYNLNKTQQTKSPNYMLSSFRNHKHIRHLVKFDCILYLVKDACVGNPKDVKHARSSMVTANFVFSTVVFCVSLNKPVLDPFSGSFDI